MHMLRLACVLCLKSAFSNESLFKKMESLQSTREVKMALKDLIQPRTSTSFTPTMPRLSQEIESTWQSSHL